MLQSLDSPELPDCFYPTQPAMIIPSNPTPKHVLYLSNLDDQAFLRFTTKLLYLFKTSVPVDCLKHSLSRTLVDFYPLAGRLRTSAENDQKLVVDCNGEGAVFAEAFMDLTAKDFLDVCRYPSRSWRKLLYKVEANSLLDIPPLVVQVTKLRCGGMFLCTAINHSLCDGIGTSHFLHAWAHITRNPSHVGLPINPFHARHALKPRNPPQVTHSHPEYTKVTHHKDNDTPDLFQYLQSQPLVPASLTFTSSDILCLKRRCAPSLKCTSFEVLASHTWRSWAKSLGLSQSLDVKLLFSMNVRKRLSPEIPEGYYGNGFVMRCAKASVKELAGANLCHGVRMVQEAKSSVTDGYVRSMIDLLEDKTRKMDLSMTLVISQWGKMGLEDLDFGEGKPLHMGPLTSNIYCLFLPVVGQDDAVRVQVSMPENVIRKFEIFMREFVDEDDRDACLNGRANGFQGDEKGLI